MTTDTNQKPKTSRRKSVAWGTFEPLLNLLANKLDCSHGFALLAIGVSDSNLSNYRRAGLVPEVNRWAIMGRLHNEKCDIKSLEQPKKGNAAHFSKEEAELMLAAMAASDPTQTRIMGKLGAMMYGSDPITD
ncbi:hypothetical protein LCGC14_0231190 [marine sediment metagenome]|uniref:Uncharacterized protein n=1 Tax=marine sediment metagenome TaxID=412755 RepID=A0A0F9UR83_9ZZZZ